MQEIQFFFHIMNVIMCGWKVWEKQNKTMQNKNKMDQGARRKKQTSHGSI